MIEINNLTKKYNKKTIFEKVNLTLKEGTTTCFVGHNGCGKSTMLKVIASLIPKNSGNIICEKPYRFAYVPEKFPAFNMKASTYLELLAGMDGIYSKSERQDIIDKYVNDFFLNGMMNKTMINLSKGTLQKIGVIQALLCKPDVLLLDEPLSGQDIDSGRVFISKVLDLKKQGIICLLAAHEKYLIHYLADDIYTICDGSVIKCKDEKSDRDYNVYVHKDDTLIKFKDMVEKEDEYVLKVNEKLLALMIDRLIKEGWHIKNVYEDKK